MQALLNDIELDVQELKCLVEALSRQPSSALKSVAKRNVLQMNAHLEMLLKQLEELPLEVAKPETVQKTVEESTPSAPVEMVEETIVEEEVATPDVQPAAVILADRIKPVGELRRSISLNDSFRFSRELFGNDTEAMNHVLQQIGEMSSLDAALAFLSSKVEADEENEAMADLVELLKKYFSNQ